MLYQYWHILRLVILDGGNLALAPGGSLPVILNLPRNGQVLAQQWSPPEEGLPHIQPMLGPFLAEPGQVSSPCDHPSQVEVLVWGASSLWGLGQLIELFLSALLHPVLVVCLLLLCLMAPWLVLQSSLLDWFRA
jgi:hypothetical protein